MTPSHITSILAELYELDPGLKAHQQQLIPLIETLLAHNPTRKPDARFVSELRSRLQARAAELSSSSPSPFSFMNFFSFKLPYALAGAALALVIAVPATYFALQPRTGVPLTATNESSQGIDLFGYSVKSTGRESLDLQSLTPGGAAIGRGGGAGAAAGDAAASSVTQDSKLIDPGEFTQYNYVFDGELPELPASVAVLQRQKNSEVVTMSAIRNAFNVKPIDLSTFRDAKVESINFVQDIPNGYAIGLHLSEGSISINQNWQRWPSLQVEGASQLKPSDIPADDVLIAIANDFMKAHGIDLSQYGEPEIDMQWKIEYDRASDKSQVYVPFTQRVIYPLVIDGKPVYEEGGMKTGINVGVNVSNKKVADMWGIVSQSYLSSEYDGVTDGASVTDYLKNFEQFPGDYKPQGVTVKNVEVKLGTPTVSTVKYYWYDGKGMTSELLVPSLVFPVEKNEDANLIYRQSVVVPLAKDVLEKMKDRYKDVMPLM